MDNEQVTVKQHPSLGETYSDIMRAWQAKENGLYGKGLTEARLTTGERFRLSRTCGLLEVVYLRKDGLYIRKPVDKELKALKAAIREGTCTIVALINNKKSPVLLHHATGVPLEQRHALDTPGTSLSMCAA